MPITVQKVTEPMELGEGPHWDDHQQALFFVSIPEWTIHKYLPATGEHTTTKLNGHVSFIIPVDGTTDQFVVNMDRKIRIIKWDGKNNSPAKVVKELFEVDPDKPNNKINDAKVDFNGRLYAGTMGLLGFPIVDVSTAFLPNNGSLYSVESDKKLTKLDGSITLANGLAWDLDAKAMYYVDTMEYNVRRYDYDVETGDISNMKHIFDVKANGVTGGIDGITIDTDGNLWLTVFEEARVIKVDPKTGTILQNIEIPAPQVTSVTFGGHNLDTLYVTTANMPLKEKRKCSAGLYRVTGLGVKGHPNRNFKL